MSRGRTQFLTEEEKNSAPKVDKKLFKRIFVWLYPYRFQFILILITIVVSSSLSLYPSVITGRIIDEGILGNDLKMLICLILLSLVVTFIANIIGVLQNYLTSWISQHITYDMRNEMFKHLQKMSQRFFTSANQGDIVTRMTSDISGVQSIITNTFTGIVSNIITLVIAAIAMYNKNWILATIGVIIVPLFTIPTRAAGKKRFDLTKKSQEYQDKINNILNETLSVSGQTLVKLFNKEEREYENYKSANFDMISLNIEESMAGRWFRVVLSTITSVGPMLIYLVGGILIMNYDSSLTVGDITVLVTLLGRMYGPVNSLFNLEVEWIRSMALFSRIFDYFDMEIEIKNKDNPLIPESANGKVTFENVSFSYDGKREILKNINFELKENHSIAIVGPSGSGKSTLINLIPRFYDVNDGSVKFDDVDVRDLDLSYLRRNIGVVTQDTYLFNGTIKDNLLYVKEDAAMEEIIEACKKANIHDFIISQKDGYDTLVGNRGLKLSGGEKQRISIARVLLKDPALFIFDEATASLDSISESKIQDAIDPLVKSHTSILIAHRLSTILSADEILVLKDGEIVERGTHKDLVEKDGVYTELYNTQFKVIEEKEKDQ